MKNAVARNIPSAFKFFRRHTAMTDFVIAFEVGKDSSRLFDDELYRGRFGIPDSGKHYALEHSRRDHSAHIGYRTDIDNAGLEIGQSVGKIPD